MGKCFICGEEVPMDHACLNAQVHMQCEGKLADFIDLRAALEGAETDNAEAVALAHQMGYTDAESAGRAKTERLEARVAELEAVLRKCRALITNKKLNLIQQFQGLQQVIEAALKGGDADDKG